MIYFLALLLGIVAGLRTMTVPAALSFAVHLGLLDVEDTWVAFLAHPWSPWILTALAIGELITDQLPSTPSRTVPVQFGARIVSGALAGYALGIDGRSLLASVLAGIFGAVIGTLGGRALRARLAQSFGRDRPAALIEDALAVGGAALVVALLS